MIEQIKLSVANMMKLFDITGEVTGHTRYLSQIHMLSLQTTEISLQKDQDHIWRDMHRAGNKVSGYLHERSR